MGNFKVYRASAGSGKTYSLVSEYLGLALADDSPRKYRKILAVTFTNKAAGELKSRVLRFLKTLSAKPGEQQYDEALVANIAEKTGASPQIIQKRAGNTLTDILHNYSRLSISTIDGFVQRLIRSFARELNLNPDFEIILDEKQTFREITRRIISQAGKDPSVTRILLDWIRTRMDEDGALERIDESLVKFMADLSGDEANQHLENLISLNEDELPVLENKLRERINAYEQKTIALGKRAVAIFEAYSLTEKDFYQGRNGLSGFFRKLAAGLVESTSNYADKSFTEGPVCKKEVPEAVKVQVEPALTDIYLQLTELRKENQAHYHFSKMLLRQLFLLKLTLKIKEELEKWKTDNNSILISDFNKSIAQIVVNEPAPFIYEITGERYEHFLIDEFQDTSVLQWQNFLPLIDNGLAKGGQALIVGDGKQSIYRFRSGEVEQFQLLPGILRYGQNDTIEQFEETLRRNYKAITIDRNFRSSRAVVEFNNDFIRSLDTFLSESWYNIFQDGCQQIVREEQGYVKIVCLEKEEDEEERNFEMLLSDLLLIRSRGYAWSDCCVLTRSNRDAGKVVAHLLENQVPVISSESLLVLNSPASRLLLSCLALLADRNDTNAQLNLFESAAALGKLGKNTLECFHHYTKSYSRKSVTADVPAIFHALGLTHPVQLPHSDLFTLTEQLARELGFMEKPDPFVQFFLDETFTYIRNSGNNLSGLLKWWEENAGKSTVKLPESLEAVRVMTIHKAKGLEFPNVLIPFLSWKQKYTRDVLWINPDEEYSPLKSAVVTMSSALKNTQFAEEFTKECDKTNLDEANLLYVALTRAAVNLFAYSCPPGKNSGVATFFHNWIRKHPSFNATGNCLESGSLVENPYPAKNAGEIHKMTTCESSNFYNRLVAGFQAPEDWDIENPAASREFGNQLHQLLSMTDSSASVDNVLEVAVKKGLVTDEQASQLRPHLLGITKLCEDNQWLGAGIKARNEMEIAVGGERPALLRPDRVVFHPDKTIVIDYKSGVEKPSQQIQVKGYMEALRKMNFPAVEGRLVYLDNLRVINVDL